jgi:PiT family inorganic phosphate transporter
MEFSNIQSIENATRFGRREMFRLGTVLLFIVGVMLFSSSIHAPVSIELVVAAMIGGYMAMNIGANDVANNVGPAVGSKALTLSGAIIIAAIFEALGALVAGGDVVSTIKKGIIDPSMILNSEVFIWVMMAALLAGAVWLNLATAIGAPVSTTHSIVGGVLGSGIAAGGMGIANWERLGAIAASWIISPLIGGIIAAGFLYWMKHSITYQKNMIAAAERMVPIMISLMTWAFSTYLIMKGLKKLIKLDLLTAGGIGLVAAVAIYFVIRPMVVKYAGALVRRIGQVPRAEIHLRSNALNLRP